MKIRFCSLNDLSLAVIAHRIQYPTPVLDWGGVSRRAGVKCEVRGGKMRGINARRWVICEAGICEAQRTTGAAGFVVGCEPLKRNY